MAEQTVISVDRAALEDSLRAFLDSTDRQELLTVDRGRDVVERGPIQVSELAGT